MYTVAHMDSNATRPPIPAPVPRPGDTPEPDTGASAYDGLGDVPAISISELGAWLST